MEDSLKVLIVLSLCSSLKRNAYKSFEYRPISVIGCMYKVLAKLLANRLGKVIHQVIDDT